MSEAELLLDLGTVRWEPSCVCEDDPGAVIRHARPLTPEDAAALREQATARMSYDATAVLARERRIAIERGKVTPFRRRA